MSDIYTCANRYDDGPNLFLFHLGAYGWTKVYVFADHVESAIEEMQDWCADNAPGLFTEFTASDYDDAASDLGVLDEYRLDVEAGAFTDTVGRVVEHAETDMLMVCHTTYPGLGRVGLPSYEVYFDEVIGGEPVFVGELGDDPVTVVCIRATDEHTALERLLDYAAEHAPELFTPIDYDTAARDECEESGVDYERWEAVCYAAHDYLSAADRELIERVNHRAEFGLVIPSHTTYPDLGDVGLPFSAYTLRAYK